MHKQNINTNLKTLSDKVRKIHKLDTEEITKTSLIMPFFTALGYNVTDPLEFIPESTADIGTKKGEKVDYAIEIDNQQVLIVEAKQFGVLLSSKHIDQLFRYYSATDTKLAILTNGDDYWFFADTVKINIMDTTPYLKIRMSRLSDNEIQQLYDYSKDMVLELDIPELIKIAKFKATCNNFIRELKTNCATYALLNYLANTAGIENTAKSKLAEILNEAVQKEFECYSPNRESRSTESQEPFELINGIECVIKIKYIEEIIDAKAILHRDSTMTILKGSIISKNTAEYSRRVKHIRQEVDHNIEDGVVVANIHCKTPSQAGLIVLGKSVNGWTAWMTTDNKPIDIYRNKE